RAYVSATALRVSNYWSWTPPAEVWDYDLAKRTRVLRKRQEVPSGHDPANYVTRRLLAPASDGELVPISLLHRRDHKQDGSAPGLVYAYRPYGMAIPASFTPPPFSPPDPPSL